MWRPQATVENLKIRAGILRQIRHFFAERQVWEVETPLIYPATVTDPLIASFMVSSAQYPEQIIGYLQTSPEFAMKRLLAAGSGSIFQLGKAFRSEEKGRYHHSEFTMLEWYRLGFSDSQLMTEIDELLQTVLHTPSARRISYAQAFSDVLSINPHKISVAELQNCAAMQGLHVNKTELTDGPDFWLSLLMSHCIEPTLVGDAPVFITDFPVSQAALAKIKIGDPPTAQRFELYFQGIELANGYQELTDAAEQQHRFNNDNKRRRELQLPEIAVDQKLIAALAAGLPECAGVALGIDRLVMLAVHANAVDKVISFVE